MRSIEPPRVRAPTACAVALALLAAGPRADAMPAGHAPGKRGKPEKPEDVKKIKPRRKGLPAEESPPGARAPGHHLPGPRAAREAVCLVEITNRDGAPLRRMKLIAFEDGVYHVRSKTGDELKLAESEVSSVRFLPLPDKMPAKPATAKRHDDPAGKGPDRRENTPPRRPLTEGRPLAEAVRRAAEVRRLFEYRQVLRETRREGRLAEHVAGLKEGLRDAVSVKEAAGLLWALGVAHHDEHGRLPTQEEWRALTAHIRDETVKAGLKSAAPEIVRRLAQAIYRLRQQPFRRGIGRKRPAP